MRWSTLVAAPAIVQALPQLGGGGGGSTLLRFACSQVSIQRLDPLVNPGANPSPHIHQIVGGNAFNASMPSTDISQIADCTTCQFSEDFSNYWTANVYFKARNGSYKRVPQIPNRGNQGSQGGFTVYYFSPGRGKTTAFKPGFRMLFGDATNRKSKNLKSQSCFRCYSGPNFGGDIYSPCADPVRDTEGFPTKPCSGIRSNIHFPTCWDGKNLDSPNHKDHVAYPANGPAGFASQGGKCPASHPVEIPQIQLEVVWDTTAFNNKEDWPEDGSQPFVLSTGDPTGFGQHSDYVFGWKGDALQKAMDNGCFGAQCSQLKTQAYGPANKCQVPYQVTADKSVDGWFDKLPGDGMDMPQ